MSIANGITHITKTTERPIPIVSIRTKNLLILTTKTPKYTYTYIQFTSMKTK